MRRLFVPASVLALALAVFGAWMHWAVLDPANVGWLLDGHDRGQGAIGLAAYLREAPPWLSTRHHLLSAPEGLTLLFTDSIPLLGLALRPLAALLPPGIQFVGPWLLLCIVLQAAFAWALVRRFSDDRLAAWLGTALLTAMPVLINRYGHASLCAQWLILWALWLFLDERRRRSATGWAAVVGVAALVHSYLLLMVAAIWASAVLRQLAEEPHRRRTIARAVPVALVAVACVSLHGVVGGRFVSTDTYGAFPMALDAWWNPANPGYVALLPSSPEDHGRGYEGLQYLGAGLLMLLALAPVIAWRDRQAGRPLRPLAWLLPAFAVLLGLALGPQWLWRGQVVAQLPLPEGLAAALDPVRAVGRLAWPLTYTLALAAVAIAARHRRAPLILGAALALQLVDLAPMFAAVRTTSAAATTPVVHRRTPDPRWAPLITSAAQVEFQPAEPFRDLALLEEIEWRAILACRPVRFAYASRQDEVTRRRLAADARAFATGRLDPTRLYVLFDPPPPTVADRVQLLDGVRIIPPIVAGPPPRC